MRDGAACVAGIDEAGRGPLAGPVVAAAVIFDGKRLPKGVNDSKQLPPERREELYAIIMERAEVGIGVVEVEEIDRINILQASLAAMIAAVGKLSRVPALALIDGNIAPRLGCTTQCIIDGDAKSVSIAAASIIAKVTRDRIMVAHDAGADLFVSIHTDMNSDRAQRGASVYTLSEKASDKEAARLAASENKVDILTGADLSNQDPVVTSILIDLAQRDTSNHSITLADELVDELGSVTRLVRHTRRFAGFVVLKSPETPSVLIELGYLSNPQDARRLAQPGYRATLAGAIVRGIDHYFAAAR